ncbi:hypothetical protein AYI68_g2847 [Smittium mucronatum]|uniref:Uncharacterized protein n=1 Tax=Smittium mucronatum TaxID=133383 RepID=A0A1R0H1M0_9FUNG|nr:hypothetical protein AYI68_g2847 [Smittium mucronatum]
MDNIAKINETAISYVSARSDFNVDLILALSCEILRQRITFLLDSSTLNIISQNKQYFINKSKLSENSSSYEFIQYEDISMGDELENAIKKFGLVCQWQADECSAYFFEKINSSSLIRIQDKVASNTPFYKITPENDLQALVILEQEKTPTTTNTFAIVLVFEKDEWKIFNSLCIKDFHNLIDSVWFSSLQLAQNDHSPVKNEPPNPADPFLQKDSNEDQDSYWDSYDLEGQDQDKNNDSKAPINNKRSLNSEDEYWNNYDIVDPATESKDTKHINLKHKPSPDHYEKISRNLILSIGDLNSSLGLNGLNFQDLDLDLDPVSITTNSNSQIATPLIDDVQKPLPHNSKNTPVQLPLIAPTNSQLKPHKVTENLEHLGMSYIDLPESYPRSNALPSDSNNSSPSQSNLHLSQMFKSMSYFAKAHGISRDTFLKLASDSFP